MKGCKGAIKDDKRQIVVSAYVAPAGFWDDEIAYPKSIAPVRVNALVDTGAGISCISCVLAEKLKLKWLRSQEAKTADGKSKKDIWLADIGIIFPPTRNFQKFHRIEVMEFYGGMGPMLLGMDIIMQGELNVKGEEFTLKF